MPHRFASLHAGIRRHGVDLAVLLIACCAFLPFVVSPPHLMDDVDAVQAQIARNMLGSGDWVTARLDGVAYLEKSPLIYWIMAVSFRIFGAHDWAARLPLALIDIALCWVTARFAGWAFGIRAALFAGGILATCVGMFLFTRILIPDAALTLCITLALWSFLRCTDSEEARPKLWATVLYASLACGLLLKGLVAALFPVAILFIYLLLTRKLLKRETWRGLYLLPGLLLVLAIAAPWHVLATLRNPPYFDFTMHSAPGEYHGFFWFYFLNEHLFRFLNMRYPRDYNTVPRPAFWLLHFAWFFPWSVTLVTAFRRGMAPGTRAGQVRLLAIVWILFVLIFFSLSTTQEYYSLPIYPALAMLLGADLASRERYPAWARATLASVFGLALTALIFLAATNWNAPTPGDISQALASNPEMYTFSLGHLTDLRVPAFAYLRLPLVLAAAAFAVGLAGLLLLRRPLRAFSVLVVTMLLFLQAARVALVRFDPYLSSFQLADALKEAPPGRLVVGDAYYAFSATFFYTNHAALLWNGRSANLQYGSYAPGSPDVFIGDEALQALWHGGDRVYLLVYGSDMPQVSRLLAGRPNVVASSGGNYLLTNK